MAQRDAIDISMAIYRAPLSYFDDKTHWNYKSLDEVAPVRCNIIHFPISLELIPLLQSELYSLNKIHARLLND